MRQSAADCPGRLSPRPGRSAMPVVQMRLTGNLGLVEGDTLRRGEKTESGGQAVHDRKAILKYIESIETAVRSAKAELEDVKVKNVEMRQLLEKSKKIQKDMRDKYTAMENENEVFKNTNNKLNEDLKAGYEEMKNAKLKHKKQLSDEREKNDALKDKIQKTETASNETKIYLATEQQKNNRIGHLVERLKKELSSLHQENLQLNEKIQNQKSWFKDLEQENSDLKEDLEKQKLNYDAISNLQKDNIDLKVSLEERSKKLENVAKASEENNMMKIETSKLKSKLREMEDNVKKNSVDNDNRKNEHLRQLKIRVEEIQTMEKELKETKTSLENLKHSSNFQNASLISKVEEAHNANTSLKNKILKMKKQQEDLLRNKHEELKKAMQELEYLKKTMNTRLESTSDAHQNLLNKISELERRENDSKILNCKLEMKLEDVNKRLENEAELNQIITEIRNQNNLTQINKAMEIQQLEMSEKCEKKEEELKSKTAIHAEYESKLQKLKAEKEEIISLCVKHTQVIKTNKMVNKSKKEKLEAKILRLERRKAFYKIKWETLKKDRHGEEDKISKIFKQEKKILQKEESKKTPVRISVYTCKLFVRNISYTASIRDVEIFFKQYGGKASKLFKPCNTTPNEVNGVKVEHKGMGLIMFQSSEEAEEAIKETNNRFFMGRKLIVKKHSKE